MKVYKGTDKNMRCRGYQYELGKTEETDRAVLCESGFHACERPLDVLAYYGPANSRYFVADLEDVSPDRKPDDTKVVGKKITMQAELSIAGLCKAHFDYVKEHITMEHTDPEMATAGDRGAATAGDGGAATAGEYGSANAGEYGAATAGECGAATAGYCGAATAGYCGAATAGNRGAATAGEYGAATAGEYGAATAGDGGAATAGEYGAATAGDGGAATAGDGGAATAGDGGAATAGEYGAATAGDGGAATAGNRGAATAGEYGAATSRGSVSVGKNGCGLVRGNDVKIRGGLGAVLVICEEESGSYNIASWVSVIVDGKTVKADTWYRLHDGKLRKLKNET